jgi:hypothetical protein
MGRRKMGGTVAMCKRILPALRRESKGVVVEYPWQEPGTATAVMQDRREELLRMNLVINPALRKVIHLRTTLCSSRANCPCVACASTWPRGAGSCKRCMKTTCVYIRCYCEGLEAGACTLS